MIDSGRVGTCLHAARGPSNAAAVSPSPPRSTVRRSGPDTSWIDGFADRLLFSMVSKSLAMPHFVPCSADHNFGDPMSTAPHIVVALIGLLHIYILVLEMFLWTKPAGLRAFGQTRENAEITKVLAANQGLYNGFLAAGLLWGVWLGPAGNSVKVFFLLCVLVAGLYGAATASRKILFIQAVPALIGLALVLLARPIA